MGKIFGGYLDYAFTPQMFGAAGDGVTDDLAALNALFAAASAAKRPAIITNGTFAVIAGSPVVPSGTTIIGMGGTIWQKTIPTASSVADPGNGEFSALHINQGSTDIAISGVRIRGPYWPATTLYRPNVALGGTGYSNSFAVTGANSVTGTATASGGVITSVAITSSGSGHDGEGDAITFDLSAGGGSGGRVYAVFQNAVYRSIGIAISGRWDEFAYSGVWPSDPPSLTSGWSRRIKITDCDIEGFGQSGIFADYVIDFEASRNRIKRCGRDGIRCYGVQYPIIQGNKIRQMAPGFTGEGTAPNNNVYGITLTNVYNSTGATGDITDYPRSQHGIVTGNSVRDCWTWKSIDTHGGQDITFADNECVNSHIGIGVDKGGFDADDGYRPPRNITIIGNRINHDGVSGTLARAGIFAVANDMTDNNRGEDLIISGNNVRGYGLYNKDGGIVVSNYKHVNIANNVLHGNSYAGISFQVSVEEFVVSGGLIADTAKTSAGTCTGIYFSGTQFRGSIDGVAFRKTDTADTMTAIYNGAQDSGYGIKAGTGNTFNGNITKYQSSGNYLDPASPVHLGTKAWGSITVSGAAASIAVAKGIASVSYTSTGRIQVTLTDALSATSSAGITVTARTTGNKICNVNVTSTTTFDVYTFTDAGVASDVSFFVVVHGY